METLLNPHTRIYVAGHRGLAGSAILRRLRALGYHNLITRTHAELDLADHGMVQQFLEQTRPECVFLAAAKVGGILANSTFPAEFIHQNLAIQTNVIHAAWRAGVKRLLFLGSSCIYPRDCPQPMKEEFLLTGPLEPTNRPYAIAKIAGIEMCWSYNRQYRTRFLCAMPTNLYGPGDNYDPYSSHVLPALIRKTHEAKARGDRKVVIWGTGNPRREFLYSDDMADACVFLMTLPDAGLAPLFSDHAPPLVNVGCGTDLTVRELAAIVARVVAFGGGFDFDTSKPDGASRKVLDVTRMTSLGWKPRIGLEEGISRSYRDFLETMAHAGELR